MDMLALIQWEDMYTSVISLDRIVQPRKSHYEEGDEIVATFKGKQYKAVICELHPNKKYLEKQMKKGSLKFRYGFVRKTDVTEESPVCPPVSPQTLVSSEPTEVETSLSESSAADVTIDDVVTETPFTPVQSSSALVQSPSTPVQSSSKLLPQISALIDYDEDVPPKRQSLEEKVSQLADENRSLRRKLRKLDDRVAKLEDPDSTLQNPHLKLEKTVEHIANDNLQEVMNVLCRKVFTSEELRNCSRTGKKTAKCSDKPRPPLDPARLSQLEMVVRKKCNVTKEMFQKKLENIQKVERRN